MSMRAFSRAGADEYEDVTYAVTDGIGVLTLNRPERRNALRLQLMADIEAVIRRFFSTVDENGVRTYQHIDLNTGDNVYGFGSTVDGYRLSASGMQHDIGFVIHDTGGTDTIDFSGSTAILSVQ